MTSTRRVSVGAALVALIVAATSAVAHELIVKPEAMSVASGSQLGFAVLSSHVFITSQELEAPEDVRAGVVVDGKRTEIPLRPDEGSLSYLGKVNAPTGKPFFLVATRLPQVWATTAKGVVRATNKTPGASNAFKIDKFTKTLINGAPDAAGFDAVLGDPLEIVLTENPASAHVGDDIGVRILASGQPVATTVNATYDGFSKKEDTYAYTTQSKADGSAVVKIMRPGLWMVRVQNSVPEKTDDYDRHVTRAVLVFAVR
jgi:uncharacterized GH25 family protein